MCDSDLPECDCAAAGDALREELLCSLSRCAMQAPSFSYRVAVDISTGTCRESRLMRCRGRSC